MNYLQQDALEKLRKATVNVNAAQKIALRNFEKAQAQLYEWTKRYQLALQQNNQTLISEAKFQKERYQAIADRLQNLVEEQQPQLDNIKGKLDYWGERLSEEQSMNLLGEFYSIENNFLSSQTNAEKVSQSYNTIEESIDDELTRLKSELLSKKQCEAKDYQNSQQTINEANTLSEFNCIENNFLSSQTNAEKVSQSYNTIEENIDDELTRLKSELLSKKQYEAKDYQNSEQIINEAIGKTKRQKNIGTGVAFISTGAIAGASLSSTIGGMGLAGGFGGIGIGAAPVVCAGAVTGAAAYGALQAIQGDKAAIGAIAIGSIGGATASSFIGSMGLVAPKIGLAVGIGTLPMAAVGGVVGLAAYGVAKMLSETPISETSIQSFERMEEKILEMDFYSAAKQELQEFLSGKDLNPQFATLEIEDELQKLKKQLLNN